MPDNLLFSLAALLTLVPASVLTYRRATPRGRDGQVRPQPARDRLFWALLALAVAGPGIWAVAQLGGAWRTGLSTALWVTIAVCMVLFAGLAATTRSAWRLAPLLLPYLVVMAVFATAFVRTPDPVLSAPVPSVWIDLHIAVSVVTYGLATLAAVAGLAAFLQEQALKRKRPTPLTRVLPPMAESEALQVRLLIASEVVLGLGLITGVAVTYVEYGMLLRIDHKTLLSLASFAVIGLLLVAHAATGVRGRRAARLVLLAYLLLTLAYPGVKFVTDVLIG